MPDAERRASHFLPHAKLPVRPPDVHLQKPQCAAPPRPDPSPKCVCAPFPNDRVKLPKSTPPDLSLSAFFGLLSSPLNKGPLFLYKEAMRWRNLASS